MIILGIDPGTATTGFGIIQFHKKQLACIEYGVIETPAKMDMGERLQILNKDLEKIIKRHEPEIAAIESLFFFKNLKTAVPVSQARGVILLTLSRRNVSVKEFTPPQAKTAVTGYGRASKDQVQKMVKHILNLDEIPKPDDAADALAIAVCCAQHMESYKFKLS
ncbi:MAG: crossover junction endodeoxyribonuclease RuvC [Candidatus Pacebacteria bacterium]|nr:crossover junction endodeoxyribonuclease RuvC [Candidatus Paceibacterota bacterium]